MNFRHARRRLLLLPLPINPLIIAPLRMGNVREAESATGATGAWSRNRVAAPMLRLFETLTSRLWQEVCHVKVRTLLRETNNGPGIKEPGRSVAVVLER